MVYYSKTIIKANNSHITKQNESYNFFHSSTLSQPAITCSKLTIGVVLVSLLLTLNIFYTLFYYFYCKL